MRGDLSAILTKGIGEIQKEMEKFGVTDWIMNLEDNQCLFSVYFLNPENNVSLNKKISNEVKKIEKFFNIREASIGKTVTMFVEVKEKYLT